MLLGCVIKISSNFSVDFLGGFSSIGTEKVDCNEDGWQLDTSFTSVQFSLFCSTSIHDKTTSLGYFFSSLWSSDTLNLYRFHSSFQHLSIFWSLLYHAEQEQKRESLKSSKLNGTSRIFFPSTHFMYPFNGDYLSGKIGKSTTNESQLRGVELCII